MKNNKIDTCPKCQGEKEVYQSNYSVGGGFFKYKNKPKVTCDGCNGSGKAEFKWVTNKLWAILGRWEYEGPA